MNNINSILTQEDVSFDDQWEIGNGFFKVELLLETLDSEIGATFETFQTEVDTFGDWLDFATIKNLGIQQLIEAGEIAEFFLGIKHKINCWECQPDQF